MVPDDVERGAHDDPRYTCRRSIYSKLGVRDRRHRMAKALDASVARHLPANSGSNPTRGS